MPAVLLCPERGRRCPAHVCRSRATITGIGQLLCPPLYRLFSIGQCDSESGTVLLQLCGECAVITGSGSR